MTDKILYSALHDRLVNKNFNDITVIDICSAASISRATFYAHFNDKYDLLKSYMNYIKNTLVIDIRDYDTLERSINRYVQENMKPISNIIKYANNETIGIMRDLITSIVNLAMPGGANEKTDIQRVVFMNFSVGGLMNTLTWMVEANFPQHIKLVNPYLYKMVQTLVLWDANQ